MKRAGRIRFLKLRRRADALELRALAAEKELADVSTRLRSAESCLTTTASTSSTFGLTAAVDGNSVSFFSAPGGAGAVMHPFMTPGRTASALDRTWPYEQ